ncbi:hypothetical protein WUBG_17133 [Wuchereria bancrofti]|uniref:Uncharacterized protein n=1 Tax=Wuchereria bancrofti TaxID=6293 RepID=J9E4R4_WUCBA|nr:hypothetical protein WUBG_17133 [Wuchereria bancrofti]
MHDITTALHRHVPQMYPRFDVMCKELCSINEETEKQVIELQLEIETTKDIKNVISAYEETLGMLRIMVGLFFAVFVC